MTARKKCHFPVFFLGFYCCADDPGSERNHSCVQMVSSVGLKKSFMDADDYIFWSKYGSCIFIMKNYIEGIPADLDEAAMIDGCSLLKQY